MHCVYCGHKTLTSNSRSSSRAPRIWRRRKCPACHAVFTTTETADMGLAFRVKKKASALEPFSREKLFLDVYKSLSHRKAAYSDAGALTDTIIAKLLPCSSGILRSNEIRTVSLEVLNRFDKAGATSFEAHHPT